MKVYNFQTGTGNYFANGILTHNCDLHARHKWLVLSGAAAEFRAKMRSDPDYFDARVAGWWCWGLCCWIGSGWCSIGAEWQQIPDSDDSGIYGKIKGQDARKPRIDGGEGQYGHGVHAKGHSSCAEVSQLPRMTNDVSLIKGPLMEKRPVCATERGEGKGVNQIHRPQLGDAYSRGRGVNGNDEAGTCEQRRRWLCDWFSRLRDRLRTVRVCCGDWLRVCDSDSVTTRLGVTGIFFDPPYSAEAGRDMNIYGVDCGKVAHDVRAYCLERGVNPMMRMVLAGYAGEGHEELERAGWEVIEWKSPGGYGNRSAKGKANAKKERLWISPHCVKTSMPLFA